MLDKIRNNEYPMLCQLCLNRKQENVIQARMTQIFDTYDINTKYPYELSFECSNVCNLNCVMCFNNLPYRSKKQKTEEDQNKKEVYNDNFIAELKEFIPHIKIAKFLGGEPFLIPIYYKIWDAILQLNPQCQIMITTNGSILNERIRELLGRGNFNICVSIDSLEKTNYEKIRLNSSYEVVTKNLEYFIDFCKEKNRNIIITTCFMQQNCKEIPDIIKFCNKNEIELFINQVWLPSDSALWNSNSSLLKDILNLYNNIKLPDDTEVQRKNLKTFNELIGFVTIWHKNTLKNEKKKIKFQNLETSQLKKVLYNNISAYLEKQTKSDEIDLIKTEIEKILNAQNDEEKIRDMITYYINTPPEFIHIVVLSDLFNLLY
ncbi:MAG: radical SAM protein [Bacteroidales bacterium]|nr:radical SAM protein [Bacteroidales bacterium]